IDLRPVSLSTYHRRLHRYGIHRSVRGKPMTGIDLREMRRRAVAKARSKRAFRVRPGSDFWSEPYRRHRQRGLEHLAYLRIVLESKSVLEVGAGIGDHTCFFVDRGCSVTTTDARADHIAIIRKRFPLVDARVLDLEDHDLEFSRAFDVVYCY